MTQTSFGFSKFFEWFMGIISRLRNAHSRMGVFGALSGCVSFERMSNRPPWEC